MLYPTNTTPKPHSRTLEEDADYLSRLHHVAIALSEAAIDTEVADVIIAQVVPLLGAQAGVVFVLSEDHALALLRPARGGQEVPREWMLFAADAASPLADAAFRQSLVVLETNAECTARYPHLAQSAADSSGALAAVPALHGGGAVGALGFSFPGSRRFSKSERTFLLLLGEQCGAALVRTQAFHRRRQAQTPAQQASADNQALVDALRSSEERLRLLLAATNDGIWDWQPPSGEVFLSARWKDILGLDEQDLPGTFEDWTDRIHPDDRGRVKHQFEAYLRSETSTYISEHRSRHQDGSYRWILTRGLALRDPQGQVVRFLGTNTDITERKAADEAMARVIHDLQAANARLEALATTDGLTGLQNERVFQKHLADEFRRARRYQTPLSLIMLDVDHFKSYNDLHGHPAGSRALRRLARILARAARATDLVCRYGGEEFVLLLPHTNGAEAAALAERLRSGVEAAPWKLRRLTISLGVCTLTPEVAQPSMLLEQADAALYAAKGAGRNRVVAGAAAPTSPNLPLDFSV